MIEKSFYLDLFIRFFMMFALKDHCYGIHSLDPNIEVHFWASISAIRWIALHLIAGEIRLPLKSSVNLSYRLALFEFITLCLRL